MTHTISLDANCKRQFQELWAQYVRSLPPEQIANINAEPPMAGPDANNLLTFCLVPTEFLQLIKSRIRYDLQKC